MDVYEVNYDCLEKLPPFSPSNNSVYVKASSEEEAIQIAINTMKFNRKNLCFCKKIPTINEEGDKSMGKVKRFSTSSFVSWLLNKIEERGRECVVEDIADCILLPEEENWVKQCEGKTIPQIKRMGYAYNDEWFE